MTRHTIVALFVLTFLPVYGLHAATLPELKAQYEFAKQKIDERYAADCKEVGDKYSKALDQLNVQAKRNGDVHGVIALKAEKERFAEDGDIPDTPAADVSVKKAQAYAHKLEAKAEADKSKRMASVLKRYLAQLDVLKKNLLMAEKLDEALAVDAEIKSAEFRRAEIPAHLQLAGGPYEYRVGDQKALAIRRESGDAKTALLAALKGLRWLRARQEADGSWTGKGARDKAAMCGLALLCYLAHGETPASEEFGETVKKAISYLIGAQQENGHFKNTGSQHVYGHAIATYALAEAYGMTRDASLKAPMEKAVQLIVDGQQDRGTWNYNYNKGSRKDLSVSAWQVQALKAASMAGASNEKLPDALYKAVDGVRSFYGGGFGYTGPGKRKTLNGAGALCLQLLGHAGGPEVKGGLDANANEICSWKGDGYGTYGWYYTTQARFQNGGSLWKKWNDAMLPMMVKNQADDGHWQSGTTHGACPVYDTALCLLCIEVYYRYKRIAPSARKSGGGRLRSPRLQGRSRP